VQTFISNYRSAREQLQPVGLVWKQQPDSFFEEAVMEADGTMVETTGECKQGIDINRSQ
jgi:hypothetical protein